MQQYTTGTTYVIQNDVHAIAEASLKAFARRMKTNKKQKQIQLYYCVGWGCNKVKARLGPTDQPAEEHNTTQPPTDRPPQSTSGNAKKPKDSHVVRQQRHTSKKAQTLKPSRSDARHPLYCMHSGTHAVLIPLTWVHVAPRTRAPTRKRDTPEKTKTYPNKRNGRQTLAPINDGTGR